MFKIILILSLTLQCLFFNIAFAYEYISENEGIAIKVKNQEINLVSKSFYGMLANKGQNMLLLTSYTASEVESMTGESFSTTVFYDKLKAIKTLQRAGISPKKAELKLFNPNLFLNGKPFFIKTNEQEYSIDLCEVSGKEGISLEVALKDDIKQRTKINLFSANDRLYVIYTQDKDAGNITNNIKDYLKSIRFFKATTSQSNPLTFKDKLGQYQMELPDDWFYIQGGNKNDTYKTTYKTKTCITIALPIATLKTIMGKMDEKLLEENLKSFDDESFKKISALISGTIANNLDHALCAVSFKTQDFGELGYLDNYQDSHDEIKSFMQVLTLAKEQGDSFKVEDYNYNFFLAPEKIGYIYLNTNFLLSQQYPFNTYSKIFYTKKNAGMISYVSKGKKPLDENIRKNITKISIKGYSNYEAL